MLERAPLADTLEQIPGLEEQVPSRLEPAHKLLILKSTESDLFCENPGKNLYLFLGKNTKVDKEQKPSDEPTFLLLFKRFFLSGYNLMSIFSKGCELHFQKTKDYLSRHLFKD